MSLDAEDPFTATSMRRTGTWEAADPTGAGSMNAHAEDPFRPTPYGASRDLEVATVDRVPVP